MKKIYCILTAALALTTIQVNAQPIAREGFANRHNPVVPAPKKGLTNDAQRVSKHQHEVFVVHEDQMSKPFNSNDPETMLQHVDLLQTVAGGPEKNSGYVDFTYDADGKMTYRIASETNTDGIMNIMNLYGTFPTVIPLNATVYSEITQHEGEYRKELYYVDTDGKRHDMSADATVYYGDELVYNIKKSLNEYGQMIEYSKTESEFDAQGRPTVTINYSPHFSEDDSMYIDLYSRYEYEYLSSNLVSKTISYYIPDEDGNSYWQQYYKIITGTDNEGYECYEKLDFDLTDSIWKGQDKYRTLTVLDDAGNARISYMEWEWDDETASWTPQDKTLTCQDADGLTTYSEKSKYSTALGAYYLVSQDSFEYLDDALVSEWNIHYNEPQTQEQLSDPSLMVSSAYKGDYKYYTKEELGIGADEYPYLEMPEKESLLYELEKIENGTPVWAKSFKITNEYALTTTSFTDPTKKFSETCHKEYMWSESANNWIEELVIQYRYDEYGELILNQTLRNDTIIRMISYQYEYITIDDDVEGTRIKQLSISRARWKETDGQFVPFDSIICTYNELGQQTMLMSCASWNNEAGIWATRGRLDVTYNDNHDVTEICESSSENNSPWHETMKIATEYYPNGIEKIIGLYINTATEGDPVWVAQKETYITLDESDRVILMQSFSGWDVSTNQWSSISKTEYTYDSDSTRTAITSNWSAATQTWTNSSKQETGYNKDGEIIMLANYNWSENLDCWLGRNKAEEERDSLGNTIHSAEYEWDDENLRWNGIERIDRQFDAEGNMISEIIYDSTDVEGNWIGFSKRLDYVENDIEITEQYLWDTERNCWRGVYRDEGVGDGLSYGYAYYVWDSEQWCWTGDEKWYVNISPDNESNIGVTNYVWDSAAKDWIYSTKWEQESISTADSLIYTVTYFNWDPASSEWAYTERDMFTNIYNDKDNLVKELKTIEEFDSGKNEWTPICTTIDLYKYAVRTGVRKIGLNSAVSVQDGTVTVDAPGSIITISSMSGSPIATGKGSVSASVRAGIYLITIDDNTVKVVVL